MPPRRTGTRSLDYHPAHRCLCGHLVYPSQRPGDPCLAATVYPEVRCTCTDHKPRGYREPAA